MLPFMTSCYNMDCHYEQLMLYKDCTDNLLTSPGDSLSYYSTMLPVVNFIVTVLNVMKDTRE